MNAEMERELAETGFNPANHSREAMIERLPGLEKVLPDFEAQMGPLVNGGCGGVFKDGRSVILLQFETKYLLVFWNPHNEDKAQEYNVQLSREAMCALVGLYQLLGNGERDGDAYMESIAQGDESATASAARDGRARVSDSDREDMAEAQQCGGI